MGSYYTAERIQWTSYPDDTYWGQRPMRGSAYPYPTRYVIAPDALPGKWRLYAHTGIGDSMTRKLLGSFPTLTAAKRHAEIS